MKKLAFACVLTFLAVGLQGCVHKVVTVPVKATYKITKGVVKGTAKLVKKATIDTDKNSD